MQMMNMTQLTVYQLLAPGWVQYASSGQKKRESKRQMGFGITIVFFGFFFFFFLLICFQVSVTLCVFGRDKTRHNVWHKICS
jgi:hypothetical protein